MLFSKHAMVSLFLISILAATAFGQTTIQPWLFDDFARSINAVDGELRIPIYELSYNESNTYTSSYNGVTYIVPDRMVLFDNSLATFETYSSTVKYALDVHQQRASYSSWGFGLPFIGISGAQRAVSILGMVSDRRTDLYIVQKDLAVFTVAGWPNQPLNPRFVNKVNELPLTYDADAYKLFLDYVGTHYYPQANFGGQIIFYVSVSRSIYTVLSQSEVQRQVGAYVSLYCARLGFKSGMEFSNVTITETFKQKATIKCEIYPGDGVIDDCDRLPPNHYSSWISLMYQQPRVLTPRVYPITNLVAAMNLPQGEVLRTNLDKAILQYMSGPLVDNSRAGGRRRADSDSSDWGARERDRACEPRGGRRICSSNTAKDGGSHDSVKSAMPPIPGSHFLGMTFDLANEELRSLPVIQLNIPAASGGCQLQGCASSTSCWRDPLNTSNSYVLPSGTCVALAGTSDSTLAAYVFTERSSFESYYEKTTKKSGFLGIKKSSKTEHHYLKKFFQEDMSLSVATLQAERYTLTLDAIFGIPQPDIPLHPKFIEAVDSLPSFFDRGLYRKFISHFGTHYIREVTVGAQLLSQDWYHRCLLYTYKSDYVASSSSFSLLIVSQKSGSYAQGGKLDVKWSEYSKSSIQFVGGNPFAFSITKYDDWLKSVAKNPTLLSKSVEPLSDLVATIDPAKGNFLAQAVDEYMQERSHLTATLEQQLKALDPKDKPVWCAGYPS